MSPRPLALLILLAAAVRAAPAAADDGVAALGRVRPIAPGPTVSAAGSSSQGRGRSASASAPLARWWRSSTASTSPVKP